MEILYDDTKSKEPNLALMVVLWSNICFFIVQSNKIDLRGKLFKLQSKNGKWQTKVLD